MNLKICIDCGQEKPISDFAVSRKVGKANFHAGIINQYHAHCKKCASIRAKKWRDAHPDYWKKTKEPGYKGKITKYPEEDRYLISAIRTRLSGAKANSRRRKTDKRPITITTEYLYNLWKTQQGKCALTGAQMLVEKQSILSLSIDRIHPGKGYIPGNVQWVCWAVNRAKGDMNMTEFLGMCEAVIRKCRDYPEKE